MENYNRSLLHRLLLQLNITISSTCCFVSDFPSLLLWKYSNKCFCVAFFTLVFLCSLLNHWAVPLLRSHYSLRVPAHGKHIYRHTKSQHNSGMMVVLQADGSSHLPIVHGASTFPHNICEKLVPGCVSGMMELLYSCFLLLLLSSCLSRRGTDRFLKSSCNHNFSSTAHIAPFLWRPGLQLPPPSTGTK